MARVKSAGFFAVEMCVTTAVGNRTARVLVVEDHPAVARMLRIFLRAAGFEVRETAVGAEALRILEREPPDAVILDLVLPDGGGGAVLDRLRRRGEHDPPAWVVISVLDRQEATSRYGTLGDRFLPKPFDPRVLLRMLRASLSELERGERIRGVTLMAEDPQ